MNTTATPPTTQHATVRAIHDHGHDTRALILEADAPVGFRGGQYLMVDLPSEPDDKRPVRRAYSIASSDAEQQKLELLVKRIPDGPGGQGRGTRYVHALRPGDRLSFQGPLGKWHGGTLAPEGPTLVVATDTGISAALGLLASRDLGAVRSDVRVLWLVPSSTYFLSPELVAERLDGVASLTVRKLPVPGDPLREDDAMRLLYQLPDLADVRTAYLAGDGDLCYAMAGALTRAGVDKARIRVEVFFTSPDPA